MKVFLLGFIRFVDNINRVVGRLAMYLVFVMMAVLVYGAVARSLFDSPIFWGVELSQMIMSAYYLLGGAYATQLGAHVRMDLLYSRWTKKKRAIVDMVTAIFLLFYLFVLLYGGVSSAQYAIKYGETNYSMWAPPMAPIKIVMVIGISLMLLQILSNLIKDSMVSFGVTRGEED